MESAMVCFLLLHRGALSTTATPETTSIVMQGGAHACQTLNLNALPDFLDREHILRSRNGPVGLDSADPV